MEANNDLIQFISTQRNQQKLVYIGRIAMTNIGYAHQGCPGKLYTNLDAPQIIRTDEHAEGCREDAHAFYHQLQLNELKRLATGIPRPILEIYDELASDASTSL
ncbi:hypothetical protein T01_15341, partial [Trichinella spiralis]